MISKLSGWGVFLSIGALSLIGARGEEPKTGDAPDAALRPWLESMVINHRFSREEIASATGLPLEEVGRRLDALGLGAIPETPPPHRAPGGGILALPYPGGRHPRIGFLDGAVDPWRETKASIFLPWAGAGYVVVDLPEALWSNLGLTFLAHKHIPTVWEKQGVVVPHADWRRRAAGVLENEFRLPNGLEIRARIAPRRDVVDMDIRLRNRGSERLTALRSQICVLLKGAPAFNDATNDNKVIEGNTIAVKARDANRWVATAWESARPWGNPPCPCMHSDPSFPDLDPGAETTVRGRLFFYEGEDIRAEIARRSQAKTLRGDPLDAVLIESKKIWDAAPHNAFTSLVRREKEWLCTFREGEQHVSADGAVRVIASTDGATWTSAARITHPAGDLRDPKLTVAPDGRLYLCAAVALRPGAPHKHQSLVWFSRDGRDWGQPTEVGDPDVWLWRVSWHGTTALGVGYPTDHVGPVLLYRSADGLRFERILDRLYERGEPNESSIEFLGDATAVCLLRRDGTDGDGQVGLARPPYTEWSWKSVGARIGGPQILRLPDGRFVAGARLYDGAVRTSIAWIEPETGKFEEAVALPSGGDTSYPGLVLADDVLWVSYYSSHEGKTSIYLARVRLPQGAGALDR
jgi:hypothetical protein